MLKKYSLEFGVWSYHRHGHLYRPLCLDDYVIIFQELLAFQLVIHLAERALLPMLVCYLIQSRGAVGISEYLS